MKIDNKCLAAALAAFPYEGKIVALEPFGAGHINDTYAVILEGYPRPRIGYILQRLNTNVFRRPQAVMENIVGVTEHIHARLHREGHNPDRGVLRFLKTEAGEVAFFDQQGMPWRSYRFIEHSFCHDKAPTPELLYQSGLAFGGFLRMLEDYPADTLHETIPAFHDTPKRLEQLLEAMRADRLARAGECRRELEFVQQRAGDCGLLTEALAAGRLPLRVTHNDTKLNNVLFDERTGKAICVIDLDTIMPGTMLNDYGDAIRFGATTAAEDEIDITKVRLSLPLFEAFTKGYLEAASDTLTRPEVELMPQSARLITLECGMRFLTDHLEGDSYFKIERPGQNLDRARTQFKLVQEMETHMERMTKIVERYCG